MVCTDWKLNPLKKMKNKIYSCSVVLLLLIVISSCNTQPQQRVLKIAVSKAVPEKSYINYINWLQTADSTVICLDMYHLEIDSTLKLFAECDGLLLTGGTDIYPGKYGKESDTSRCWEPDFKRDSIEIALIHAALQQEKPILGICRGLQLLNVYLGGSLYIDLPTDLDTIVKHQCENKYECYHDLEIQQGSLLFDIAGESSGITNSNHHQGIEQLASPLEGIAYTNDGLIESIQWKNKSNKPFLLGVQWHPERMDYNNPLSGNIAHRYLKEVTLSLKESR